MQTRSADERIWTWVSEDGKHARSTAALGSPNIGMKPGAGNDPQPYDKHGLYLGKQYAANSRSATDAGLATKGPPQSPLGGTKRGKEMGKRYVLPSNVMEENKRIALVYSQSSGELTDMEDRLLGKGYSGAPGSVNVPDSQSKKDQGVIPQGTWAIGEVIWNKDDTRGKGENLIKLDPDQTTSERVRAMGRDPNTFYIHAGKQDPNDRSASQGCIIMKKNEREALRELQGAKIRVVR